MDGRTSALCLLTLALASSGCVTTTEKTVTVRSAGEPPAVPPAAIREEDKKPPPPRVLLAMGTVKEQQADALKDHPDIQARLRDEARRAYQEILKTDPDHVEAIRGVARIYARMGDYERAQDTYQKAVAKHPRDVALWFDFGMMYDRRKQWPEGMQCFRKGLEIDPEDQQCLKALGFTLARTGQIEQSLPCLTRAMGSSAAAHYVVAKMLLHLAEQQPAERPAREALARTHLQQSLADNPNYQQARDLLARLDSPNSPGSAASEVRVEMPALTPTAP
jgi:tetratricopeptide (TPR) repeat protein